MPSESTAWRGGLRYQPTHVRPRELGEHDLALPLVERRERELAVLVGHQVQSDQRRGRDLAVLVDDGEVLRCAFAAARSSPVCGSVAMRPDVLVLLLALVGQLLDRDAVLGEPVRRRARSASRSTFSRTSLHGGERRRPHVRLAQPVVVVVVVGPARWLT